MTNAMDATMPLTHEQQQRFARNIALPEIGEKGQARLLAASILIVGAGGLGSPAALYLVAAGVGTITLMDGDAVELGNLQRQILHAAPDIGRPKVESAAGKLKALNPGLIFNAVPERLSRSNGTAIVRAHDFTIDATDNFESKCLIADLCHIERKPHSHGGILHFTGQTMTVIPGETACYRCIFTDTPDDAEPGPAAGPLGPLPGIIGAIQAAEAVKHILGFGILLTNRMLTLDLLRMNFRPIPIKRNEQCPLCAGVFLS